MSVPNGVRMNSSLALLSQYSSPCQNKENRRVSLGPKNAQLRKQGIPLKVARAPAVRYAAEKREQKEAAAELVGSQHAEEQCQRCGWYADRLRSCRRCGRLVCTVENGPIMQCMGPESLCRDCVRPPDPPPAPRHNHVMPFQIRIDGLVLSVESNTHENTRFV